MAAVAAALAVAVGTFYQYLFYFRPSALVSVVLSVLATFTAAVVGPVVLALGASLTVAGRRDPDRPFAAGVLITGGILTLLYFCYSHVFGWVISLRGAAGWALEGDDIGVGAAVAMAVAGIALLVGGPGRWDPGSEPAFSPPRRRSPTRSRRDKIRGRLNHRSRRPRATCAPPRTSMTATPAGSSTRS